MAESVAAGVGVVIVTCTSGAHVGRALLAGPNGRCWSIVQILTSWLAALP